jgi:hypothetical protein
MQPIRWASFLIAAGLSSSLAQADAPMVWPWVKLKVWSCQAVTFEESPDAYGAGIKPASFRTAVVSGYVLASGLHPYDQSQEHVRRAAELMTKSFLPREGAQIQLAMHAWNLDFCRKAPGDAKVFSYSFDCDTLPRRGHCLSSIPLATPDP